MEETKKKLSKDAYGGVEGKDYVPFITSGDRKGSNGVVMIAAILLAVLFAASTAYSGMKSGLTVAAGIPGAILGSGIVSAFAKQKGIFGKNLLQAASSGGESVASGMIFVVPAIILVSTKVSFIQGTLVGIAGVLFGIGISTLIHDFLLVDEHGKLPYPESMAISETLVASEGSKESLKYMGIGFGISGILTLITGSFLNLVNNVVEYVNESGYKWKMSTEASPMLLGIGYIVGTGVSLKLFAGSVLANFAALPLIGYFSQMATGEHFVWNDPSVAINAMTVGNISNSYIRYIGAGMMLSGGIIGAISLIPVIINSVKKTLGTSAATTSGEKSSIGKLVIMVAVILSIVMSFMITNGNILMSIVIGLISMFFAMLFVIVAGHLTGTIGTSNLPVSGMTIAALVVITVVFKIFGWSSDENTVSLLLFGTFVVTAISMAGGYQQSQKVGFILGADKNEMVKYLAITSVAGVLTVMGTITVLADKIAMIGDSAEFAIPQANLMATLTSGILSGNLPWAMIFIGVVFGLFFYALNLPVMTIAVGFYLPIASTSIILIGSLIRLFIDKTSKSEEDKEVKTSNGISLSAGLVAGASIVGLIGITLSVLGVLNVPGPSGFMASNTMGWIVLSALVLSVTLVMSKAGTKDGK